jgi:hypothetical protein
VRQVIGIFVAASVLIGLAFVVYPLLLSASVASLEDRASFGEMFGTMGALFTALAFAAVTCSIVIQYQQLKGQQESAEETQRQVASQLEVAAETAGSLERTARLNGLAALAQGWDRELTYMEAHDGKNSPQWARAIQLYRWAITEVELLSGLPPERGLYYEPPELTSPPSSELRVPPHRPSSSFTYPPDAAPPVDASDG